MTAVENEVPLSAAGNPIGFGRMPRKEDVRFLRGRGNYVDDINLPGMLHSAILRSPYAHARIVSIDTSARRGPPEGQGRHHGCRPRHARAGVDADAVVRHAGGARHRQGALPRSRGRVRRRRGPLLGT